MTIKKTALLVCLASLTTVSVAAQTIVKAEIDSPEYRVGEIVRVLVRVENNPGLHSLFFDLAYDESVLLFEGVRDGSLVRRQSGGSELLYADNAAVDGFASSRTVVSFTLSGQGTETESDGALVELSYRVTGSGAGAHSFRFAEAQILDGDQTPLTNVTWQDSNEFAIVSPFANEFILIRKPYDNQAFYTDSAPVSVILSEGDYLVRLRNNVLPGLDTDYIPVQDGRLLDWPMSLASQMNTLTAELYAPDPLGGANHILLTSDSVKVYRSDQTSFVQIIDPPDHSLLNSDMVEVRVRSSFDSVLVNGMSAQFHGEMDGDAKIFESQVWLTHGFNTISAVAVSDAPESSGVTFTDEIQVYYQKDDSIFTFVEPSANQGFKPSPYSFLSIKGEIDSLYKTSDDPATGGPVENRVTIDVTYIPRNPMHSPQRLAENQAAVIEPSDFGHGQITSTYIFRNDIPIPLEGLEDGELEIVAYKNRDGSSWDDRITRIVFVDAQRLWIDLVQPNVFTSDLLDTEGKIIDFNINPDQPQPITNPDGTVTVTDEGAITLASTDPVLDLQALSDVGAIVEAADGSLYALVNASTSLLRIYRKPPGGQWSQVLSRSGMYGYDLVATPIGLLLGVSNIPSNGNSGLYLVNDDQLVNLRFSDESLPHVQFVELQQSTVYLYGSLFDSLYSFNLYDLEEEDGAYRVGTLAKSRFATTETIDQFILARGASTAMIRSDRDSDNIHFYRRDDSGFSRVMMPAIDGERAVSGRNVVYGPYENSDYDAYLVLQEGDAAGGSAEVVMQNLESGRFFRRAVGAQTIESWLDATGPLSLLGVGFVDSQYTLLYEHAGQIISQNGQIFFDSFTPLQTPVVYVADESPAKAYEELFVASGGAFYLGVDSQQLDPASNTDLYQLYRRYGASGSGSFRYVNDDVDGLTGFSFEIDPATAEAIDFGFGFHRRSDDVLLFDLPETALATLLEQITLAPYEGGFSNDAYTVTSEYNDRSGRTRIHVELDELRSGGYFAFTFTLRASQDAAPAIHAIEVFKKIAAKITNPPGATVIVPIQGFVYDRTVEELLVQHVRVPVGRDGSFSYAYEVQNTQSVIPVEISGYNAAGERAELRFTVEIVESENDLWDVTYENGGGALPLAPVGDDFLVATTNRELILRGNYFGLAGAVVGYEIYSTQDSDQSLPLQQGQFATQTVADPSAFAERELGTGYEAGTFASEPIELVPNEQRLVVFVENPGGVRHEYTVDGSYPLFDYSMPSGEQRIVFDAETQISVVVDGIPFMRQIDLAAVETAGPPFLFVGEDAITGQINALEQFDELLVRSYTPGLLFENGETEIVVAVEPGNRFSIPFTVTVPAHLIRADFDVAVIPTIPVYNYLREGIRVSAQKSFADTWFVPDFSIVHPEHWSEEERRAIGGMPVRFTFRDRDDIPIGLPTEDHVEATLTVNFATEITGYVDRLDGEYFTLRDIATDALLRFDNAFKLGQNRIQWRFDYVSASGIRELVSSSYSGRPGMIDEVFTFTDQSVITDTVVTFQPALDGRYYDNGSGDSADHLPLIEVIKDQSTNFTLTLNGTVVPVAWADGADAVQNATIALPASALRQGRNELTIAAVDREGAGTTGEHAFLYDSLAPSVAIASVQVDAEYTYLTEVSAVVTEANFERGYLYAGSDVVNLDPRVEILGRDAYLLIWENLGSYALDPSAGTVRVEVHDRAGRDSSDAVYPFADVVRPAEDPVRERPIDLPQYSGVPAIAIESNYENRAFADHTVFAPRRMLGRVSVQDDIEAAFGVLMESNTRQKINAPAGDRDKDDQFGNRVAISGNYALVGARGDSGYVGAAFLFHRAGGVWEFQQKLTAPDVVGNGFAQDVALSGDYALVGAWLDSDPVTGASAVGSAYLFRRTGDVWELQQKLTAPDGDRDAGDRFGWRVALSGDYALVGAYADSDPVTGAFGVGAAYLFHQNNGTWEFEQKLTAPDGDRDQNDRFGDSVALSGNYALVGAFQDDDPVTGAEDVGAAYLFHQNNGTWEFEQKLTAPDGDRDAEDEFGSSVALSGDYALVGARRDDDPVTGIQVVGAAYLFHRTGGVWELQQKLTVPHGDQRQGFSFGRAVALSGDYALVGAQNDDDPFSATESVGTAHLFYRTGAVWELQQKLTAPDGDRDRYDRFGISVALSGDRALVGAEDDHDSVTGTFDVGSAYAFSIAAGPASPIGETDSILDSYDRSYLVFEVAIDTFNNLTTKEDLEGKIRFEVYGVEQSPTTLEVTPVGAGPTYLVLDAAAEQYVQGVRHLYYMVDIDALQTAFQDQMASLFTDGAWKVDAGSLRIVYDESLENFSPADIYVTGREADSFTNIVVHDQAYEGTWGPNDEYVEVVPELQHTMASRTATRSETSEHFSLSFWLRIDDAAAADPTYAERYKRLVTFRDAQGTDLYHLGYRGVGLDLIDEVTVANAAVSLFDENPIGPLSYGMNRWNQITLRVDATTGVNDTSGTLMIDVRDPIAGTIYSAVVDTLTRSDLEALLAAGASVYFGADTEAAEADELFNTGFYSIANPFSINRLLSDDEITRVANLEDSYTGGERFYGFLDAVSDYGVGTYDLHPVGGADRFADDYNADYTIAGGSLKASAAHPNLLARTAHPDSGQYVTFAAADSAVTYNVDVSGHDAHFTLDLSDGAQRGWYHFGDKESNYGLGQDRWYSVSGTVVSLEQEGAGYKEAWLVMTVNGATQRQRLFPGGFHFIYDNENLVSPVSVKLSIETEGSIALGNDLVLNEGNWRLPVEVGFEQTAASLIVPFDLAGTIGFWYKPFAVNAEGRLNYDVVLFDSEYLTIGARESGNRNEGESFFYAEVKGDSDGTVWRTLQTDVPVTNAWHYLQLSYDWSAGIWYFYVDGSLAAFHEGSAHELFGTLVGEMYADGDNVRIGSDMTETVFAEGYIDEVTISKYYSQSLYRQTQPVRLVHDEGAQQVALEYLAVDSAEVTDVRYALSTLDGSYRTEGTSLPAATDALLAGRYRLHASMTIAGRRYDEILTFNVENKPRFNLVGRTPLVFDGEPTELSFIYEYDHSYRYQSEALDYVGVATRISYNGGEVREAYLVQDFIAQDPNAWLLGYPDAGGQVSWSPLQRTNAGLLAIAFAGVVPNTDIGVDYEYFYFSETFTGAADFSAPAYDDGLAVDQTIPLATLLEPQLLFETFTDQNGDPQDYYYMVRVQVSGDADAESALLEQIIIEYEAVHTENPALQQIGEQSLEPDLSADFYFDDILPDYGTYNITLRLKYRGITYAVRSLDQPVTWRQRVDTRVEAAKALEIEEFSLLLLDQRADAARIYLEYSQAGAVTLGYSLTVKQGNELLEERSGTLPALSTINSHTFEQIPIPKGSSTVRIRLESQDFIRTHELSITNNVDAPQIVVTTSPESLVSYNDVLFTWKGYAGGQYRDEIEYAYEFDSRGRSSWSPEWRSVRFYNLEEGNHTFSVQARYRGVESIPNTVSFFVDIKRPEFDPQLIELIEVTDEQGVAHAFDIVGHEGAVSDASLRLITVDADVPVTRGENGSFEIRGIPITTDGEQSVRITAIDRVGNYSDYELSVDNALTTLLFPAAGELVRYSPLTLVGRIDPSIDAPVEIYVRDPFTAASSDGSFTGWKRAQINADRTFFVEDVFINPGTRDQAIATPVELVTVVGENKQFSREVVLYAKEILLPIELSLSTHAAEGENAETQVDIHALANIDSISSWSIDFDGDGVYDAIDLVSNPAAPEARAQSWSHTYSSIGLVEPRVRVITTDGTFFSVSDTIIIHEKIREASHKLIDNAIAFSSVRREDRSERIFVLTGTDPDFAIEVYDVGRHATSLSHRQFTIDLSAVLNPGGSGTIAPFTVRAIDDQRIVVASVVAGTTTLFQLVANEFGNYQLAATLDLPGVVHDLTFDEHHLFAGYSDRNYLTRIQLDGGLMVADSAEDRVLAVHNSVAIGEQSALAKDAMGLLVADYYNQRVVRFTNALTMQEQFGTIGTGERAFLTPTLIESYENRIFVFDERRGDIQVFDQNFTPVTTLEYRAEDGYHNYLESDFFVDLADMSIMTRVEGNRLYYYALLLSRSTGKLAMLRLPQWEELRARVRNNAIVFLQDGEVYTAKPNGSDLRKILATDSLPRIEGALDYPALSPDGRELVFTSRLDLYVGQVEAGQVENLSSGGNPYAYDQIYLYDIEERHLRRLMVGGIEGAEIERPVFNSNGDQLVFSAKQTGERWQLYTVPLAGGAVSQLFVSDENARFPYYSPDDQYIVFTTDYDGDEDVVIVEAANPATRVDVTNNAARDSLPVWIATYPHEVSELSGIESKIAFVSEHQGFQKALYYTYVQHIPGGGVNIVNEQGENVGNDPDSAAIRVTPADSEGDYPSFTGDGTTIVFEHFDGSNQLLRKHDKSEPTEPINDMPLPANAVRPAGMKNMITNFTAQVINGNELRLGWDRYTESDIFYVVEISEDNEGAIAREIKVLSQTGTTVGGLQMGQTYRVRVLVRENEEEVATSRYQRMEMPVVAARPHYAVDEENPYIVHLGAWKPEQIGPDLSWNFAWIIDNREILVQTAPSYSYEFATSGRKSIQLKAYTNNHEHVAISEPFFVEIVSDIEPVIESVVAEDGSYVELSAESSLGRNIDYANALWTISGPGGAPLQLTGPRVIAQLDTYRHKINVSLTLSRTPVGDQAATDSIVRTRVIDLDFQELLPVISVETHEQNPLLLTFSGQDSLGNIDWYRARWVIYADNQVLYESEGASTFDYLFPEQNEETVYTVSLTIPSRSDGTTQTVSQIVSVEATPIEPVIEYQVIQLTQGDAVIGQKIIFDATKSSGNGIDFSQARWSVATAGDYGEQAAQIGPVATYNLVGIHEGTVVEVALTLMRRGGADPTTVTQLIQVADGLVADARLVVESTIQESSTGAVVILDVLRSSGPNIDWERTEWLIDGQYTRRGPVARYDVPTSAESEVITYSATLYRYGGQPQVETGQINLAGSEITPLISYKRISPVQPNVVELSVLDTEGSNIDWERTEWFLYDGNQDVVTRRGAVVNHAFALTSDQMGYPVMVRMYYRGDVRPFVGYKTIDIEGAELTPVITYTADPEDPNVVSFSAESSVGDGIDWARTKWTFIDSSATQYGPVATHTFPAQSSGRTYTVMVTLYRTTANGQSEAVTGRKQIRIGAQEIEPVVLARVYGDYLVLSAERSEGPGLLLDRSVWTFPGEGDAVSILDDQKSGKITTDRFHVTNTTGVETGVNFGPAFFRASSSLSGGWEREIVDYSSYEENSSTFATQNMHTGAIARRYVAGESSVIATLFVFRVTSDGGTEGRSITVRINLNEARAQAESGGVVVR